METTNSLNTPDSTSTPRSKNQQVQGSPWSWSSALTQTQITEAEAYMEYATRWYDGHEAFDGLSIAHLPADVYYACLGQEWHRFHFLTSRDERLKWALQRANRRQLDLMMSDLEKAEWDKLPRVFMGFKLWYDEKDKDRQSYSLHQDRVAFSPLPSYQQKANEDGDYLVAMISKFECVLKLIGGEPEIVAAQPGNLIVGTP